MGWLYMRSIGTHSGPRQYLDNQFTSERPELRCRVLRSALVSKRVYYAAVEFLRPGVPREVAAIVCLVRYNPRDRGGYVFGYKDMDEGMGPCEAQCPEAILDLLTPTDRPHALAWRARSRENAAAKRARAAKPGPRPGQTIVFDRPLAFQDGRSIDRFEVVANTRGRGTMLFRDPKEGAFYRIPNVKRLDYRLDEPAT